MFSLSQIRAKARQTILTNPGMLFVAIIPVALTIFVTLFQSAMQNPTAITAMLNDEEALLRYGGSYLSFQFFFQVLIGFMSLSLLMSLFQFIQGKQDRVGAKSSLELFSSQHFGKIFRTVLLKQVYLLLWASLMIFGLVLFYSGLFMAIAFVSETGGVAATIPEDIALTIVLLFFFGLILIIGGLALYFPNYYAYSQVELLLFDQLENGQYAGANAIIKESRYMMRGYKGQRFALDLTFLGWFLLSNFTFGMAGIYVIPYYTAAQIHFYKDIKVFVEAEKEAYLQFLKNQDPPQT
ncbi:DUF975 family protein [Streptococcus cameli]